MLNIKNFNERFETYKQASFGRCVVIDSMLVGLGSMPAFSQADCF